MDDLISRMSAVEALGEKPLAWTESEYELGLQNQWQSDVNALINLPSAEPGRKHGRWVARDGRWHCSMCDAVAPKGYRYNYCPDCGVKMEPYKEEKDGWPNHE